MKWKNKRNEKNEIDERIVKYFAPFLLTAARWKQARVIEGAKIWLHVKCVVDARKMAGQMKLVLSRAARSSSKLQRRVGRACAWSRDTDKCYASILSASWIKYECCTCHYLITRCDDSVVYRLVSRKPGRNSDRNRLNGRCRIAYFHRARLTISK